MPRWIMHVDMDAFFAAIEQRDHAEYRNKPVIVGGSSAKRGVVSTASYEARKYGVHSAMAMAEAEKKCPDGIFLAVDMAKYHRESQKIMEIFSRFTPAVEQVSVDEAFLDISGTERLFGMPEEIGCKIKAAIKTELDLTASVGIANSKFIAKIASELNKPDGLTYLPDGKIPDMLWPLPIKNMFGVGNRTAEKMKDCGISTIGQLAKCDRAFMERIFGKNGAQMHDLANGIDPRPVETVHQAKSSGREITFAEDITDREILADTLSILAEDVAHTLRRYNLKCHGVSLKFRYADLRRASRAMQLAEYTSNYHDIYGALMQLLAKYYHGEPVRLIGLAATHLKENPPLAQSMFDDDNRLKREKLDRTQDLLTARFGKDALKRARHINTKKADKEL